MLFGAIGANAELGFDWLGIDRASPGEGGCCALISDRGCARSPAGGYALARSTCEALDEPSALPRVCECALGTSPLAAFFTVPGAAGALRALPPVCFPSSLACNVMSLLMMLTIRAPSFSVLKMVKKSLNEYLNWPRSETAVTFSF